MAMQRLDFGGIQGAIGRYAENIRRRNELIAEQQRGSEEKEEERRYQENRLAEARIYAKGEKTADQKREDDQDAIAQERRFSEQNRTRENQLADQDKSRTGELLVSTQGKFSDEDHSTAVRLFGQPFADTLKGYREAGREEKLRVEALNPKHPSGGLTSNQVLQYQDKIRALEAEADQTASQMVELFPVKVDKTGRSARPESVDVDGKGSMISRQQMVQAVSAKRKTAAEMKTALNVYMQVTGLTAEGEGGEPGGQSGELSPEETQAIPGVMKEYGVDEEKAAQMIRESR